MNLLTSFPRMTVLIENIRQFTEGKNKKHISLWVNLAYGKPLQTCSFIRKLYLAKESGWETTGKNGRDIVCSQYRRENAIAGISEKLEQVVKASSRL
jgi:hypothetical protein